MEKFFKLKENGTSIKIELIAGLTTFMTMAYILAVNPAILSNVPGMPREALFTATALASLVATLVMALLANLPFAIAPGMGMNAFFTFGVCLAMKKPFSFALTAILVEGLLFLVLSAFNVREAIVKAIPENLKKAISAGIGLFIAFIGFQNAGIIVNNDATLVGLGKITEGPALLAIIGIVVTGVLLALKVKGALLIGIFATTLVGIPMGITKPFGGWEGWAPLSMPASISDIFFKFDFSAIWSIDFLIVLLSFFFVDVFDTVGTFVGVSMRANMVKPDGTIPRMKQGFIADACGTISGAIFGTSAATTYVESAAGVEEGGRTGLTALTVAILFGVALFLSPLFLLVPGAATAPALILVGLFMMASVLEMDLSDYTESIPGFLCLIIMPLSYSIAEGLAFGLISYVVLKLLTGRAKEVPIATYVVSAFFLVKYFV
ncbi:MAG: NCS2 family permease [Spirochaetaceae bacterium]|nr:NCS2 family permease [Spirochaetaceae bacterium]